MKAAALACAFLAVVACGSGTPTAGSSPASPSPAVSPSPSPSPSPAPSPSPFVGQIGLAGCPDPAPAQHALAAPGGPGQGVHSDPSLKWEGCGTVTVPPGTDRFMTGDNWQIGFSATCPDNLNYGASGMDPGVAIRELLIDGSYGPDEMDSPGPWSDGGGGLMSHGGNYQLKVQSIDARCRWSIAVYPAN